MEQQLRMYELNENATFRVIRCLYCIPDDGESHPTIIKKNSKEECGTVERNFADSTAGRVSKRVLQKSLANWIEMCYNSFDG